MRKLEAPRLNRGASDTCACETVASSFVGGQGAGGRGRPFAESGLPSENVNATLQCGRLHPLYERGATLPPKIKSGEFDESGTIT